MLLPWLFLLALIGLAPVIAFVLALFDFPILQDAIGLAAAGLMAVVCFGMRRSEAVHLMPECRFPAIAAGVILLWMLLQLLPLPAGGFSAGTWDSAASALGQPLWSKITIDPGATVVAFCRLLAFSAIAFLTAAVALDRLRAEIMLTLLASVCVVAALVVVVHNYSGSVFLGEIGDLRLRGPLAAGSTLGAVLIAALATLIVERRELRRSRERAPLWRFAALLALSGLGFLICWLAILLSELRHLILAASAGIVVIAIVNVVRRIGLGAWSAVGLVVLVAISGAAIVATSGSPGQGPLLMRYAGGGSADIVAATLRILGDMGWAGTGAATFGAVLPVYGESVRGALAPTFAAQLAVELGQPMLWLCVAMALGVAVLLGRGALLRGRDSCHAAAASGAIVALVIQAFGDASLANFATSCFAVIVVGLGFGQRTSRSV